MSKNSDELDELPAPDYDRAGVRYTPRVRTVPHGTEYVMKLEDLAAMLAALAAEQLLRVLEATGLTLPAKLRALQRELEQERQRSADYDGRRREARMLLSRMVRYARKDAQHPRFTGLVDKVSDYLNRTSDPRDILRAKKPDGEAAK